MTNNTTDVRRNEDDRTTNLTAVLVLVFAACLLAMAILETALCRRAEANGSIFDPATGTTTHYIGTTTNVNR